ncbi:protein ANTAGONIST OF LIKE HETEROCHROMATIN PROTEIN 1-like [Dendronephthya gigantea]|uniref:protein ANTAGONIST OF LIKE HETEROCHROMATIN PROTEIN 1-like n=1 Tax=Dendronephthya gigantea TaxID=151771 RepID=UPI001069729B|nr:protein ANTAGONIST OF LIKE HETEROCHROMATIN PROTEIN 1-like [Dendronephthya gigantea]
MELAVLEYQFDLIALTIRQIENNRRKRRERKRKRKRREVWMRSWIGRRRQFGIYDQLLVELRSEDTRCFKNFMRMVPEMFDELLARVSPRITKKHTWYRRPLKLGLNLSLILRHLASGSTYSAMKYGWRVPHNTQSLIVREVCQAIIYEYMSKVMTTPEGWRAISDKFLKRWNFPHTCGAIDGKHIACKCPPKSGSQYFNYKGFYSVVLIGLVDANNKFIWADLGGKGSSSDAQIYNNSEIKELTEDGTIGFPVPDAFESL